MPGTAPPAGTARTSTLVVVESMWGNTRTVAEAVAEAVRERGGDVTVLDVADAPSTLPADVGLLVVGGPTHAFSMSRPSSRRDAADRGADTSRSAPGIREWLAGLESPGDVDVATFDTRVGSVRRLPGSAARAAARAVRRHHLGHPVGTESFYVADMTGPLLDGELERGRSWGRSLTGRRDARPT